MRQAERSINILQAHTAAVATARRAGLLLRKNLHKTKKMKEVSAHDIKLELDVRCQQIIEADLKKSFPSVSVIGEEGLTGDPEAKYRWVVDPIDGTVNFTYGIPHASVSIALQEHAPERKNAYEDGYSTLLGVVHDPFCDEMWTARRGKPALMNGRRVGVSSHATLDQAVVSVGFSKTAANISAMTPYMLRLVHRVRKLRIMGSAALALVYVAGGRFDAYVERGLRLWDIAAGGLIVECAGGEFWREPVKGDYAYRVICTNGLLRKPLRVPA